MKKHFVLTALIALSCMVSVQAQRKIVSFFDEFGQPFYTQADKDREEAEAQLDVDVPKGGLYTAEYDATHLTASVMFTRFRDTIIVPDTIFRNSIAYTVIWFEQYWFDSDGNYTTLQLPRTLRGITIETMLENKSLATIEVPEDNPYITTIDGVLYDKNVTRLIMCPQAKNGTLYLPKTVKEIDDLAFYNCHELERIVVEEGNSVFHTEDDLLMQGNTLVAYPAKKNYNYCFIKPNVTSIAKHAIPHNCKSWIVVDKDNKYYMDIAGVLYSKNGKTLIAYPGGRTTEDFSIPEGITSIASTAFYGCAHLCELTLPRSIKEIEAGAFDHMKNMHFMLNYSCVPKVKGKYIEIPCLMFVPEDMVNKYKKNEKWKDARILPMTASGGEIFKWYFSAPQKTLWYTCEYPQLSSYFDYKDAMTERIIVVNVGDDWDQFNDFTNVKEFLVMDGSRHSHISDDGVLINIWSDGDTALAAYPRARKGQDYIIPEYVSVIEQDAFYNCHLSTLYIPSKLHKIYADWNTLSYFLEGYFSQFVVSPENQWFYSKDGVLFEKGKEDMSGKDILMSYPQGKQDSCYTIPQGVSTIRCRAFHENQYLQEIHILEDIQWIACDAFKDCKNLKTIYMYSPQPPKFDTSPGRYRYFCEGFYYATKIYVPEDAIETYKNNREWAKYADIIFPMPKQEK